MLDGDTDNHHMGRRRHSPPYISVARQGTLKRPFGVTSAKAAGMSFGERGAFVMAKLAKKAGKS